MSQETGNQRSASERTTPNTPKKYDMGEVILEINGEPIPYIGPIEFSLGDPVKRGDPILNQVRDKIYTKLRERLRGRNLSHPLAKDMCRNAIMEVIQEITNDEKLTITITDSCMEGPDVKVSR